MSTLKVNSITDSTGGSNAQLYGVASPPNSMGFRNRIINGAMVIDQRNAGASVTMPATGTYSVDRWQSAATQASKVSFQQNAGAVTPPAGFKNYLGITSLSAYSVGASDFFVCRQAIEGLNCFDLNWGTANAQAVTVSFWVRSSLTGTFGGSLFNVSATRSYPFSYTISNANTWEQKTITVSGDTTGTWASDNTTGIFLSFGLGVGSTYSGTANTWAGAYYLAPTGATSVVGTNGATFYITGVQLEAGTVASPFERRDYGRELMMCQRYYWKLKQSDTSNQFTFGVGAVGSAKDTFFIVNNPVQMRSAPTATQSGTVNINYNASAYAKTAIGGQYAGTITTRITWNDASLVAGGATWFDFASGAYIEFSSEL